jgi:hypothetical protein
LPTDHPWLPQPDSQPPPAAPRQRDARSLLSRGPDQFLGRAAVAETRVRRPVRRHDHVEEVDFQPAAHRGLRASASMSVLLTLAVDEKQ